MKPASSHENTSNGASTRIIITFALVIFCAGPFFSLVGQGTLPSVAFSIAAPLILLLLGALALAGFERWLSPETGNLHRDILFERYWKWGGLLYGIGTLIGGWFVFQKLEVSDTGLVRGTVLTHPGTGGWDKWLTAWLPTGNFERLVRKELRLQSRLD